MEKLAIATRRRQVADHFGHCDAFLLVEVEAGVVRSRSIHAVPAHTTCTLPAYLSDLGVTCVIGGGMGVRAQQGFAARGISTCVGVQGPVETVLKAWLKGSLTTGENSCNHEGCGNEHHHGAEGDTCESTQRAGK